MPSVDTQSSLAQLQGLLYSLFRFDTADLDFGMYRLLKIKQAEVRGFIEQQLPTEVNQAFQEDLPAPAEVLYGRLQEARDELLKNVGEQALKPDGSLDEGFLSEAIKLPVVKKFVENYQAALTATKVEQASEEKKIQVFNTLYNFFRRYYDNGDFVPRHYYGTSEAYAIPYNGEETAFYWSTKGQHYVKTGERLRDYSFTVKTLEGDRRVRFQLAAAETPKENLKGKTRFYLPLLDQITYDEPSATLTIAFVYRLPTEDELNRYGTNSTGQEAVLQAALPSILAAAPELFRPVLAQASGDGDNRPSYLLRHLRLFVRRQTTDYFIHPNLANFLTRELDFYLKDQVFPIGDVLTADLTEKQRFLRVVRRVALNLITFLAEIENVENRLFEKRKLVLRSDYLVPVQNISRDLWPEVIANADQLKAWRVLFSLDSEVTDATLEHYPTLVVNTQYFSEDFKWRLLANFEDIDAITDGILVHSENYQALNFLNSRFASRVKCIYVDPPYNTDSDEFLYKDSFKHASWLSMMEERLHLAKEMLARDGSIFVQIGDEENANLKYLLSQIFGEDNFRNSIIVRRGIKSVQSQFTNISSLSVGHDTIFVYSKNRTTRYPKLNEVLEEGEPGKWDTFWRGTDRPTMRYEIFGIKPEEGQWRWSEKRGFQAKENYERYVKDFSATMALDEYYIRQLESTGDDIDFVRLSEDGVVQYYVPPRNYKLMSDVWMDVRTRGDFTDFPTEKHIELIETISRWITSKDDLILDFFGGSGSTAHAVIDLHRITGEKRKFISIEFADYFENILLPRIQRIIFSPLWKDGKPYNYPQPSLIGWPEWMQRTPKLIQVLDLEFFEDSLHNLTTEATQRREEQRAAAYKEVVGENEYRLQYLARLPMEANASMLVTDDGQLNHPFSYTLETLSDTGPITQTVDLITTFNYLHGLHVERVETWINPADNDRLYRVVIGHKDGRRELVIWRDMAGLNPEIERTFLEERFNGYDHVWINGDTASLGAVHSIDAEFKRLLEDPTGGLG